MPAIPLTIDSSSLLRDPTRHAAATNTLEHLIAHKEVSLQLSTVVIEEVVANLAAEAAKAVQQLKKGQHQLSRRLPSHVAKDAWNNFEMASQVIYDTIQKSIEEDFRLWLAKLCVEILPVDPSHGAAVMQGYFAGTPPFSDQRSRVDIPDAFIYESIRTLAQRDAHVCAVISDERLRKSIDGISNVQVYGTLDAFIGSDHIQAALGRARASTNLAFAIELLRVNLGLVENKLAQEHIDRLGGETIQGSAVPGDNNEATIEMVGDIEGLSVDWDSATYYGEGRIAIAFAFTTEVYADSALFRSDYYAMSEEETESLSISSLNEHFVSVEREYNIEASGLLVVDFHHDLSSEQTTPEVLKDGLPAIAVSIDSWLDVAILDDDEPSY